MARSYSDVGAAYSKCTASGDADFPAGLCEHSWDTFGYTFSHYGLFATTTPLGEAVPDGLIRNRQS